MCSVPLLACHVSGPCGGVRYEPTGLLRRMHTRKEKVTYLPVSDTLVPDPTCKPRRRRLTRVELARILASGHGVGDDRALVRQRLQYRIFLRAAEENEGPSLVASLLFRRCTGTIVSDASAFGETTHMTR